MLKLRFRLVLENDVLPTAFKVLRPSGVSSNGIGCGWDTRESGSKHWAAMIPMIPINQSNKAESRRWVCVCAKHTLKFVK
eukprot:m.159682 g.159682  ORF g.159682 m.159682 type:complete len:80 (-) comp31147_c0_seq1:516-755(-)